MSMRLTRTIIITIAIICTCTALAQFSYASMVTVDVEKKTSTSDTSTLEPTKPRVKGEQVGILVKSTIVEPQFFTVKFAGLKDQDYDTYINYEFKGLKSAKELKDGVQYKIEGSVTDPNIMRCLYALKERIKKASAKLESSSDAEAKRIYWTLGQASGWVSSGLGRDQAWRSTSIILAPSGRVLSSMTWMTREDEYETARATTNACWLLQQARDRMYRVIENPTLRNDAVIALTPVDFTATYSTKNGKPHVDAKVTNNCNLPISGNISFALPPGWKTNAKQLKFNQLKSGNAFDASFDLIAPQKTIAPKNIPIAANVTVASDKMTASMKLKIAAHMNASLQPK